MGGQRSFQIIADHLLIVLETLMLAAPFVGCKESVRVLICVVSGLCRSYIGYTFIC